MATTTKKKSAGTGSSAARSRKKKAVSAGAAAPYETNALPTEEELEALVEELEGEEVGLGRLTGGDRIFLARLFRFLSGILGPRYVRRAVYEGYTMEEHLEGWGYFDAASGRHRTLAMGFEGDVTPETFVDPERRRIYEQLDELENLWFPRTKYIIERYVPAENVERFLAAFFRELKQQPAGPLVADSVAVFLDRVEALATSAEPGAKEVAATLKRRGLTPKRIAATRELLAAVRTATTPIARRSDEAREADRLQEEGLEKARQWWNDWATTLRPRFDVREQIALGLTELRADKPRRPASSAGAATPASSAPVAPQS